jgi:hypothetical protein
MARRFLCKAAVALTITTALVACGTSASHVFVAAGAGQLSIAPSRPSARPTKPPPGQPQASGLDEIVVPPAPPNRPPLVPIPVPAPPGFPRIASHFASYAGCACAWSWLSPPLRARWDPSGSRRGRRANVITWFYNQSGSGGRMKPGVLHRAFRLVRAATNFQYRRVHRTGPGVDITIRWRNLSPANVLATGGISQWRWSDSGHFLVITRGVVTFNRRAGRLSSSAELSLSAHEIAHASGCGHAPRGATRQVMNPTLSGNGVTRWGAGDVTCLQRRVGARLGAVR